MRNPLLPKRKKKSEARVVDLVMSKEKLRFQYQEAYCFITYKGKGKTEVIYNARDGEVPTIIYSKDGTTQLSRVVGKDKRDITHVLKDKELYFANTTKKRARFLAKKIVYGRWNNSRYPLCQQYSNKKEAIFLIANSLYGNGDSFTILKHGRNKTTYMHKHFKGFISAP